MAVILYRSQYVDCFSSQQIKHQWFALLPLCAEVPLAGLTNTMLQVADKMLGWDFFWPWPGDQVYSRSPGHRSRDHSGYELSQWETTLPCNVVSHWLSPYPEWSLRRQIRGLKRNIDNFRTVSLTHTDWEFTPEGRAFSCPHKKRWPPLNTSNTSPVYIHTGPKLNFIILGPKF